MGALPGRVPNRFFKDEGFAVLECQDSGFYSKIGATFGIKSSAVDAGRRTHDAEPRI